MGSLEFLSIKLRVGVKKYLEIRNIVTSLTFIVSTITRNKKHKHFQATPDMAVLNSIQFML